MAEYIEREALLKKMHALHTVPSFIGHRTDEDVMFDTMVSVVEEQPVADVVPVVRCKDCKHYTTWTHPSARWKGKELHCGRIRRKVNPNDYCNYGERRCNDEL